MKNKLGIFRDRLKKVGVEIELVSNFPWVYLERVNGHPIKEKNLSDHGYQIATYSWKDKDDFNLTVNRKTFDLIRKYK